MKVRQAGNRMAGGAATSIGRAEANEEAAHDDANKSWQREQRVLAEQLARSHP